MAPPELPQELYIEILLWLPVESLLRFRCLSKSLCAIIDGSYFINLHLNKSSQNFSLHKLIYSNFQEEKRYQVFDVNLEEKILSLVQTDSFSQLFFYGNCNGLLLLDQLHTHRTYRLLLWNPSTRQSRSLPDCPFEVSLDDKSCNVICTGLGYDDSIDDYKALIIVRIQRKLESEIQVWIYGLKSNIWRKNQNFSIKIQKYSSSPEFGHFCVDGSLNWLFTRKSKIVTFDVRKETFSLLPQPVCSIQSMGKGETKLHVLSGCLSISYFLCGTKDENFEYSPKQVDLYIRKKDGADEFNWIKLFSITETSLLVKYCFDNMSVLGYSNRGGKIMLEVDGIVPYDLKEKRLSEIEVEIHWRECFKIMFLKSLVSVASGA